MNLALAPQAPNIYGLSQKSEIPLTIVAGLTDDSAELPCTRFSEARRQEELDRLIRKYRPLIKKLCAGYALQREDAEDLEATTLLTVCRRFDSYDPSRGMFGTWLGAIIRNEAADARRRASRQPECIPSSAATELLIAMTASGDRSDETVEDWAEDFNLSPLQRQAFELVKLQGLTCAEAGAVMGRTEGTVRTYIWKARQILRRVGK